MEDSNSNTGITAREKLDQVATWVSTTVISAFFASLERCACVNLTTTDPDEDEDEDEANDRPLTFSTPHPNDIV